MENYTIKTKQTQDVEMEVSLPKFFSLTKYRHIKMINESALISVIFYTDKMDSITALELWPSIQVEHSRYLSYIMKPDDIQEITEEEFNGYLNAAKKLISSL
jgi:hypothetical protein